MNIFRIIKYSFNNFKRNFSRYLILLFSITTVVFLFFASSTISNGMLQSISDKARRYHAGDLIIQAYQVADSSRLEISHLKQIDDFLENESTHIDIISKRSLYLDPSQLFFNGQYIIQRRIIGVDWENEAEILSGFTFVSGSLPEFDNRDAILISTSVSEYLNVSLGDQIILSSRTQGEQINTQSFIVHGIFNESNFFGYASYIHRSALNSFANRRSNYINELGIRYRQNSSMHLRNAIQSNLWRELSKNFEMLPILQSRSDRREHILSREENKEVYALITLNALLSELSELSSAIQLIILTLLFIFTVLIFIGVCNTYSQMMTERKREIATMRAIGAQSQGVVNIFLFEGMFLTLLGTALGIVFSIFFLSEIEGSFSNINLSFFSLILTDNKLVWNVSFQNILLSFLIVSIASLLGIYRVVNKVSKEFPIRSLQ